MTTDEVKTWLEGLGIAEAFSTDGEVPAMPDRIVVLTLTGGPGERRERSFDVVSVQTLVRGGQRSAADGEALAAAVDNAFMGAVPPVEVGSTRVISIARAGGPPAHVSNDASYRRLFSCSYLLECARSVF
jgi:hypothetical protein